MLVLTRKFGESIVIGDSVTVTVIEVKGERVRLGISAPAEVPVHREEVFKSLTKPILGQLQPCHLIGSERDS